MSSKLEPVIWLCDTGHIGIHGGVDGRTVVWSYGDQNKTKFSRIGWLPYFLNYGALYGGISMTKFNDQYLKSKS